MSDNALELLNNKQPVSDTVPVKVAPDKTVEITVRAVGRERYQQILDAHTTIPEKEKLVVTDETTTEDVKAKVEEEPEPELQFDKFILQLVAESIYDPAGVTVEVVTDWYNKWTGPEFDELAKATMNVNGGSQVGELVKD